MPVDLDSIASSSATHPDRLHSLPINVAATIFPVPEGPKNKQRYPGFNLLPAPGLREDECCSQFFISLSGLIVSISSARSFHERSVVRSDRSAGVIIKDKKGLPALQRKVLGRLRKNASDVDRRVQIFLIEGECFIFRHHDL